MSLWKLIKSCKQGRKEERMFSLCWVRDRLSFSYLICFMECVMCIHLERCRCLWLSWAMVPWTPNCNLLSSRFLPDGAGSGAQWEYIREPCAMTFGPARVPEGCLAALDPLIAPGVEPRPAKHSHFIQRLLYKTEKYCLWFAMGGSQVSVTKNIWGLIIKLTNLS